MKRTFFLLLTFCISFLPSSGEATSSAGRGVGVPGTMATTGRLFDAEWWAKETAQLQKCFAEIESDDDTDSPAQNVVTVLEQCCASCIKRGHTAIAEYLCRTVVLIATSPCPKRWQQDLTRFLEMLKKPTLIAFLHAFIEEEGVSESGIDYDLVPLWFNPAASEASLLSSCTPSMEWDKLAECIYEAVLQLYRANKAMPERAPLPLRNTPPIVRPVGPVVGVADDWFLGALGTDDSFDPLDDSQSLESLPDGLDDGVGELWPTGRFDTHAPATPLLTPVALPAVHATAAAEPPPPSLRVRTPCPLLPLLPEPEVKKKRRQKAPRLGGPPLLGVAYYQEKLLANVEALPTAKEVAAMPDCMLACAEVQDLKPAVVPGKKVVRFVTSTLRCGYVWEGHFYFKKGYRCCRVKEEHCNVKYRISAHELAVIEHRRAQEALRRTYMFKRIFDIRYLPQRDYMEQCYGCRIGYALVLNGESEEKEVFGYEYGGRFYSYIGTDAYVPPRYVMKYHLPFEDYLALVEKHVIEEEAKGCQARCPVTHWYNRTGRHNVPL